MVVTPERAVLDEAVDFVALPMYDGELGVLPGRAPLIGRLGYGELRIRRGEETQRFFIDGGFAQVRANVVTVLTPRADARRTDRRAGRDAHAGNRSRAHYHAGGPGRASESPGACPRPAAGRPAQPRRNGRRPLASSRSRSRVNDDKRTERHRAVTLLPGYFGQG